MKNLKKVLSLALAFAMVLGLCVGAMAADTPDVTKLADWADVTNKDAAQLLNAFGIMAGDDKGNFNPANNVTRAEAVKMIDTALWGGKDESARYAGSGLSTFADIAGNEWYAGYIVYATTIGIVGGRNATTFDPKGNVTGYELLKMALTALGYDQNTEGLVGGAWKVNTMALAMGSNGLADLTKDVNVTNWDAPISRDNTAKVVANMIYRTTVKYDRDGYLVYNTNGKDSNGNDIDKLFGVQYLGLTEKTGVIVANTYGSLTTTTSRYTVTDATKANTVFLDEDDKPFYAMTDTGVYELGSVATVYFKGSTPISTVVTPSVELTSPTAQGETTATDIITFEVGNKDATTKLDVETKRFDTDDNGKYDVVINVYFTEKATVRAVTETEKHGTIYQTGSTAWRSSYETAASFPSTLINVQFVDKKAAEAGDHIIYALADTATSGNNKVKVGAALETVEGTVTRVVNTATTQTCTINGVDYSMVNKAATYGQTGTFYVYPGSTKLVDIDAVATKANVALLYDAGYTPSASSTTIGGASTGAVLTVAAILPDGTTGTYNVTYCGGTETQNKVNTDAKIAELFKTDGYLAGLNEHVWGKIKDTTETVGKGNDTNYLVNYYLDDDGNMIITGKTVNTTANGATVYTADTIAFGATVKTDSTTVKVGTGNKLITPETVTFMQTTTTMDEYGVAESWTVVTGRSAAYTTVAETNSVDVLLGSYNGSTNAAVAYAVAQYNDITHDTASSSFYYIISYAGQTGNTEHEYVVFDADKGEVVTLKTSDADSTTVGGFYKNYANKAFTAPIEEKDMHKGYITSFKDGIIILSALKTSAETDGSYAFATSTPYTTNDKTKYYVLGDDKTSMTVTAEDIGTQEPSSDPKNDVAPYQAIVLANTDGVATHVIVFEKEIAAE